MDLYEKIQECVAFIRSKYTETIDFAVVLGSGLSNFEKEI